MTASTARPGALFSTPRSWADMDTWHEEVAHLRREHGSVRVDGTVLAYNAADPYLPDLLICHPALAEKVLAVLAEVL